ncbi:MAG TPA: nucleotide exchange factor GrpE [Solirubrobacterales bacterium]|nr:nucleotide exchange factor GrpE [Solirubrobacterales bacterium]
MTIEQDGVTIGEGLEPDTVEAESPVEDGAGTTEEGVDTPVPLAEAPEQPASSDADPSPSGDIDDLRHAVESLDSRLEESQRLLVRQTDLVDRLHAENGELRAGELRNAQLPLVRDLLRLHDDVGRMRGAASEDDHDLRIIQESLVDILGRNGIQPFAPEPGESFDPLFHTASGVEPTLEEALDKAVIEVVRQGFRWESGDTIRVAEVRAYRYRDSSQ